MQLVDYLEQRIDPYLVQFGLFSIKLGAGIQPLGMHQYVIYSTYCRWYLKTGWRI